MCLHTSSLLSQSEILMLSPLGACHTYSNTVQRLWNSEWLGSEVQGPGTPTVWPGPTPSLSSQHQLRPWYYRDQGSPALMPPPLLPDKIEDELEMTMVCHRPEGLEQLEAQTNFTKRELQVLYRGFKNVRPLIGSEAWCDFLQSKALLVPMESLVCKGSRRPPLWTRTWEERKLIGEQGLSRQEPHPLHRGATGWGDLREALPAQVLTLAWHSQFTLCRVSQHWRDWALLICASEAHEGWYSSLSVAGFISLKVGPVGPDFLLQLLEASFSVSHTDRQVLSKGAWEKERPKLTDTEVRE